MCALAFPDISRTYDRGPDSGFGGHLIDNDARIQAHDAPGCGIRNFRILQEGTTGHSEAQGASGFDTPGSTSATIAESSSSLPDDGLYSHYGVRDDYPRATSSSRGQVEDTVQSQVVTQGQDAAHQEAVRRRREQKTQEKREGDRRRKRADRAGDEQAYSRVCSLLAIKLDPKNTLSQRSECLCTHRVGDIERFVVLKSVESIDQDFERMCELLEISMTPKETLAHRSECLCIHPRRRY